MSDDDKKREVWQHFDAYCKVPHKRTSPYHRSFIFERMWADGRRDPFEMAQAARMELLLPPMPSGYQHGRYVRPATNQEPVRALPSIPEKLLTAVKYLNQEIDPVLRMWAVTKASEANPLVTQGRIIASLAREHLEKAGVNTTQLPDEEDDN